MNMKYFKLFFITSMLALFALQEVAAQSPTVWRDLSAVTYRITEDEFGELYVPVFSDKIRSLEGKVVEADGYIIPFEGLFKPEHIILSSLPLAECFFCGSGGPETVMEAEMTKAVKYTSKKVRIRGTLTLNDSDPERLMYIMKNAQLID
ncbi:hypothetical protein A3SI_09603 [Nitritalea halalkaliphila LW7]|uniref:DUF3299 domain-containing protein n=2 Tax=Nitritalea TaxID=1187887 RepID=I5C4E2_9BACT|nr:hypothetical protein A3SI_09603 [Nitritalea halalkaliphila LW7]